METKECIVVFDLDETIIYSSQLGLLLEGLKNFLESIKVNEITNIDLFSFLIELFPNFLRPSILMIMETIYKQKLDTNNSVFFVIYTNNNKGREWVSLIADYIELRITNKKYVLFDSIVNAYRINKKIYENCRTTSEKNIEDLKNCLECNEIQNELPVFFVDDREFEKMKTPQTTYIHIEPYIYEYSINHIIQTLIRSNYFKTKGIQIDKDFFIGKIMNYLINYKFKKIPMKEKEYVKYVEMSSILNKRLEYFFNKKTKTLKIESKFKTNRTRKNTTKYYRLDMKEVENNECSISI